MKSIIISKGVGLDKISNKVSEIPKPKPKQVLIQWHATSLNYHDYLVATGGIPVPDGRIPMSDGAGEIIEIGGEVTKWKTGDKVMSLFFQDWIEGPPSLEQMIFVNGETVDGFMTEMSCVPAYALTKIPDGYSYEQAATLPCAAATAWRALQVEGNLQAGEKVLIEGTGGMSIFALQFAKAFGATVYATSSSPNKVERLKQMGVVEVLNYKEDPKWGKNILALTNGGVDHVLDVGGGSTMKNSIDAARIGGKIYSIGILGNGRKGEITFPKLFFKHLTIKGIAVGNRKMQEDMIAAIEKHKIEPIIDKTFAFDQLADAFKYQESGQHFGKIVLSW